MNLPKDPMMLLSVINMQLRDFGQDLDEFVKANDLSKEEIVATLKKAGFEYNPQLNQFR